MGCAESRRGFPPVRWRGTGGWAMEGLRQKHPSLSTGIVPELADSLMRVREKAQTRVCTRVGSPCGPGDNPRTGHRPAWLTGGREPDLLCRCYWGFITFKNTFLLTSEKKGERTFHDKRESWIGCLLRAHPGDGARIRHVL